MNNPRAARGSAPHGQQGVALAVSLVLLLALTIIGISALGTTAVEERMAGNTQELNRAFHMAETGLVNAYADVGNFDLNQTQSHILTNTTMHASVQVETTFKQFAQPGRGSNYSAVDYSAANFETISTGMTDTAVNNTLHQGAFQITPKIQ